MSVCPKQTAAAHCKKGLNRCQLSTCLRSLGWYLVPFLKEHCSLSKAYTLNFLNHCKHWNVLIKHKNLCLLGPQRTVRTLLGHKLTHVEVLSFDRPSSPLASQAPSSGNLLQ